jgi:hypothetical protein
MNLSLLYDKQQAQQPLSAAQVDVLFSSVHTTESKFCYVALPEELAELIEKVGQGTHASQDEIDDMKASVLGFINTEVSGSEKALNSFRELTKKYPLPVKSFAEKSANVLRFSSPKVVCGACHYFQLDRIGDGSGIGECFANIWQSNQPLLYPTIHRVCDKFLARVEDKHAS